LRDHRTWPTQTVELLGSLVQAVDTGPKDVAANLELAFGHSRMESLEFIVGRKKTVQYLILAEMAAHVDLWPLATALSTATPAT